MDGIFKILSLVATALFAANQGAELGQNIREGKENRRLRRASRRVQPTPRKASLWLEAGLRRSGHDVEVKPGFQGGQWSLLVFHKGVAPPIPETYEGYKVSAAVKRSRKDRRQSEQF